MIDKTVNEIVEEGYEAGLDEDTIIMQIFTSGLVPFHDLAESFKTASIELGFMQDPKVLKTAIAKAVATSDWQGIDTWDELTATAERVVAEVDGATLSLVISAARAHCKNEEIELPKKPKGAPGARGTRATGGSKVQKAILNLLKANPEATKTDAFEVLYPVIGGKSRYANVLYHIGSSFMLAKAAALGASMLQLTTAMQGQRVPADPELKEHNVQPGDDAVYVPADEDPADDEDTTDSEDFG